MCGHFLELTNTDSISWIRCLRCSPCISLNPFCPLLFPIKESSLGSSRMLWTISWYLELPCCSSVRPELLYWSSSIWENNDRSSHHYEAKPKKHYKRSTYMYNYACRAPQLKFAIWTHFPDTTSVHVLVVRYWLMNIQLLGNDLPNDVRTYMKYNFNDCSYIQAIDSSS